MISLPYSVSLNSLCLVADQLVEDPTREISGWA